MERWHFHQEAPWLFGDPVFFTAPTTVAGAVVQGRTRLNTGGSKTYPVTRIQEGKPNHRARITRLFCKILPDPAAKHVTFTLKKSDGTAVASETVAYLIHEYDSGNPANPEFMRGSSRGTATTDGSGNIDLLYTGPTASGGTVYVVIFRPYSTTAAYSESLLWTETVD